MSSPSNSTNSRTASTGHGPGARSGWLAAGALGCMLLGSMLQPAVATQQDPPDRSSVIRQLSSSNGGGVSSDSNNRMIAVTGVDLTGQSVLYLVDTEGMQLCAYQATGGSGGTQGLKLVGARRISLDLQLDGFNDDTEDAAGKPLPYKALEKKFIDSGLPVGPPR